MTVQDDHPERTSSRRDAVHIVVACSFAIAQPIFDVISGFPTYFVAHEMTPMGVGLFALGIVLVPAVVLIAIHRIVRAVSARAGRIVLAAIVGMLAAVTFIVPLGRAFNLGVVSGPLVAIVVWVAVAAAYLRSVPVRRLMTWLAPAPLVFLALFFASSTVRVLLDSSTGSSAAGEPSDTPVVVVVLDELSLGSILDPDGVIDAERFPHFAELGERSTWYPNMSTNAYVTPVALPTITTGVFPKSDPRRGIPAPVTGVHPNNLFTLLDGSHDLHADEFVTRLCPTDRCPGSIPRGDAWRSLISDTVIVYLRTVLPDALADRWVPSVGSRWANFLGGRSDADHHVERLPGPVQPLVRPIARFFSYDPPHGGDEMARVRSFIQGIEPGAARAGLHFLHANVPHDPYQYLPGNKRYAGVAFGPAHVRWRDDPVVVAVALQRYLLQLKATDEVVGELIERLDDNDMWDRALVVLMADHGVSFVPGEYRRRDTPATASQILPTPLFVKYPGQEEGKIDRRNAQMMDVLPTIADVLGIDVPWRTDGTSLRSVDPGRRTRRVFSAGQVNTYPAELRGVTDVSETIRELFGSASGGDDLYAWGPHRSIVGTKLAASVGSDEGSATIRNEEAYTHVNASARMVPAGLLATIDRRSDPGWVAVALNGRIAGLARPIRHDNGAWTLSAVLSPRYFRDGRNHVELLTIDRRGRLSVLRRVQP